MKNFTSATLGKLVFSLVFILLAVLVDAQTYSTDSGDWTTEWSSNSGIYQATGGPGVYSYGTTATDGQVSSRNLTSDGTTSGSNQAMQVGQKLTIKLTAPIGGGRSGIQTGGRIGFALKNRVSFYDGTSAQARYFNGSMLRCEYQGGQSAAQLVDGAGTTTTGMPGFTDFTNGLTYEVEVISDKEYNFQVVSGSRLNIRPFSSTGQLQQISIADLGENRDGVYTNFVISNMPTVGLTANTGETFTVTGVISNKASANTVTKYGAGTVVLTGQNTYSGTTTVSAGTLQLNGSSANTIKSGNSITVSNGATLRISQDQTFGTLTLPTGANLIVDAGKTLTINGIFNSGGNIQNNGTIKLAGSLPQSFPGSGTVSAMNNLTINNNSVTLDNAELNVTGTLAFEQKFGSPAILSTGSNVITAASVSGAGATNGWVNGNLARNISASGAAAFDIGDAANYLPVSLNIQASGFTAGTLQVSTRTPLSSTSGYSTLSLGTANTINRVWSVFKPSGSTFTGSYSGTYTYLAGDVTGSPNFTDLRQGVYDGTSWAYPADVVSNSGEQITQSALVTPSSAGNVVFGSSQPVTISGITAGSKTYDATTSATLNFGSAQANGLLNGDVVTVLNNDATGSFDDKHVGVNKNVTLSGTVTLSGSQAGAYYISSMQSTALGDITPLALEITAAPNSKQYDGNVSAAAIPAITSGAIQGADEALFTESYATPDVGTGKELIPEGVVSDGNAGNNYTYTFVSSFDGEITNIQITINSATPGTILCSGGTTTLTVSASGGVGQLLYSLSGTASFPNQTSNIFTGVGAGTYTLTVTDESEAFETLSDIVITEPQTMSATFAVTDESVCAATPDGSITVSPSGGTEPYTYTWSGVIGSGNPATTPYTGGTNSASISDLKYGFYNVNIADANGCNINVTDIHVKKAHLAVITHNGEVSASCANTGTLIIYASAGVAPYTYSADGVDYQESNTFTGLAAGPMTIYVKDAGGCISTKDYTILSAPELTIDPYVVAASSCHDDGSIKIYRTGGIPPYTYSVDGSSFVANNLFTGLAAGSHTATVRDSKGCETTTNVTVSQGTGLTATVSRKSNTSACVNNGSFQVSVTGGVGPFTYSLDGGEPQSSNSFTGLGAGNYVVTVTDSRGCTGSTNTTINTINIGVTTYIQNAPDCNGTGSVKLMPAGGSSPYTYSLDGDNYQTSPWFYNLAPGTYTGFIKDSKTCIGQTAEGGIIVGPEDCNSNMRAAASVKDTEEQAATVKAFPNPSVNEFTVDLKGFNMNEKVMITVTDLLGRKVYQTEGTGMMQYKIGSRLLPGMYNVTIVQGEKHFALKVVKE